MNTHELITPQHLARKAIVYVRQSTLNQTLTNQESLELQYALKQRAIELGWQSNDVLTIDSDLGITGGSAECRSGFKEIVTQVTLGYVGIILSYDVTRLSRNCSDWYPLLDVCGYRNCLIADRDGIYDSSTTNGRLLLGLKGQLAEVELSTIRARLTAGLLNKAKRGDLALRLPAGLIRNTQSNVVKDPNLEIQQCITMVFGTFLQLKSASKTLKYFVENELSIPRYDAFNQMQWKRPTISSIASILKNPAYAGAFVYGRTQTIRQVSSLKKTKKRLPIEQWNIVVHNKFPAYIEWEIFGNIQRMLENNYAEYRMKETIGTPRAGAALLQGIIYCGKCGHKMCVKYKKNVLYLCNYHHQHSRKPMCQFISADYVEKCVVEAFFQALSSIELDAYTEATKAQEVSNNEILKAHTQQLQRLKYETKLAECQFNQVDPNNRLVAAELEKRWENALHELQYVERNFSKNQPIANNTFLLSEELKSVFIDVGKKLPDIWDQDILSFQQKKAFLRCLIEKVVMHRQNRDSLLIRIVWQGGETTTLEREMLVGSFSDLSLAKEIEHRVIELAQSEIADKEIAEKLTELGYHSPMRGHFLPSTVAKIRWRNRIFQERKKPQPLRVDGYLTVLQIAKAMNKPKNWIYDHIRHGKIKIIKDEERSMFLFPDSPKTIEMFDQLKNGHRNSIHFSEEHQDE